MIHGKNHIGNKLSALGTQYMKTTRATDWRNLNGIFVAATNQEIQLAVNKAKIAFQTYKNFSGRKKAIFLEAIAIEIEKTEKIITERVMDETGLSKIRIRTELKRTTQQLRIFSELLKEGSWVEAKIDTKRPFRKPLPRLDIRKMLFPVGPVVVFTASNFPLAFSTAGGDTASALAAGCPVIVKSHEGHLGTNQLVADAIIRAAKKTGMPDGVFSSVQSYRYEICKKLVTDPAIKAVAFTGSKKGGSAIIELCSQRPEPIPVYAEMGSVNPVLLLPFKLCNETAALAKFFAASISKGSGQFCTKPGVLIAVKGDSLTHFAKRLIAGLEKMKREPMLNEKTWRQYQLKKNEICYEEDVEILCNGNHYDKKVLGTLVTVSVDTFLEKPLLQNEIFGPMSILVECENIKEMEKVVNAMSGQLTFTVMASAKDIQMYTPLLSGIREIAGRIVFNGPPTGVEVCNAMHHGGGYPASTNAKYTSVGQDAIKRFVHPVAFQSCPQSLLPDELKNENPLRITRLIDGEFSTKEVDNLELVYS